MQPLTNLFTRNFLMSGLLAGLMIFTATSEILPSFARQSLPAPLALNANPNLPELLKSQDCELILLDFYSKYCSTCQFYAPYIEQLGDAYKGKLQVIHIDVNKSNSRQYALQYRIMATPTYILFNAQGKPVYQQRQGVNFNALQKKVQSTVELASKDRDSCSVG